jgi:serine/threonine protein kinase/Tol biopolymer transport system component
LSESFAPALTGRRLGVYQVQERIGAGGMGEVYQARDTRLGRDVAIKILPQIFTADPDRLARFEREARVLASLNHPNIGAIYGLEEADGVRALVLELVEGETLVERIRRPEGLRLPGDGSGRPSSLPIKDALAIARQIAEALDAAHEKGIVHRDLKPANIKITPDGRVKVLDFGLAKAAAGESGTPDLTHSPTVTVAGTRDGVILGTAAYMSPEQARGYAVDKRADIWAFGCVLYEMLTGGAVFRGETISDTIAMILERAPDWSALPAATPSSVRHLLRRCLDKDPKQRLRDIGDARIELSESGTARQDSPPASSKRRVGWLVAAAVAGLIAGAIGAANLGEPVSPRPRRLSILAPAGTTFTPRDITGHPQFAISPDGESLAFVAAQRGERPLLWVRSLESAAARPLAGTEEATGPFWGPDSRNLAFFARSKLKRVSVDGTPPRDLADIAVDVTGGTWNAEDVILFGTDALYRVSANGGVPVLESTLDDGEVGHRWPQFLPDGRRYVYYVRSTKPGRSGIYIGSVGSNASQQIVESGANGVYADPGRVLFDNNGALSAQRIDPSSAAPTGDPVAVGDQILGLRGPAYLPLSIGADGTLAYWNGRAVPTELAWFNRTGGMIGRIETTVRSDAPALSPDGTKLIFTQRQNNNENTLFTVDLSSGVGARLALAGPPGIARFSIWSPDARNVLFGQMDADGPKLVQKAASGAGAEIPLRGPSTHYAIFPEDWSRDGRWIVYSVIGKTAWDTWALDTTTEQAMPILDAPANQLQARLSPDGRWMAYASDESGMWNVYVQPFPDGPGRWQVSQDGGSQPLWRADGKELFYIDADGRLVAVPVAAGPTFEQGRSQVLFETRVPALLAPFRIGYAVSPDGQRFLLNNIRSDAEPVAITVVLNWR